MVFAMPESGGMVAKSYRPSVFARVLQSISAAALEAVSFFMTKRRPAR
jgi:hypothetical protein